MGGLAWHTKRLGVASNGWDQAVGNEEERGQITLTLRMKKWEASLSQPPWAGKRAKTCLTSKS